MLHYAVLRFKCEYYVIMVNLYIITKSYNLLLLKYVIVIVLIVIVLIVLLYIPIYVSILHRKVN